MTITEFYETINGNYEDAFDRFQSDDFLVRFIKMFVNDKSYESLVNYIKEENAVEAFRAAHTLKGASLNLGFDNLAKPTSQITEVLRLGNLPENDDLLNEVTNQYMIIMKNIDLLD